jgi:hypothetical protein
MVRIATLIQQTIRFGVSGSAMMAFILVHFKAPRISTACPACFYRLFVLPASCRILSIKNLSSWLILQGADHPESGVQTVQYLHNTAPTVQYSTYSTSTTVANPGRCRYPAGCCCFSSDAVAIPPAAVAFPSIAVAATLKRCC